MNSTMYGIDCIYPGIKEIAIVETCTEANKLLVKKWRLLSLEKNDSGGFVFVLGRF